MCYNIVLILIDDSNLIQGTSVTEDLCFCLKEEDQNNSDPELHIPILTMSILQKCCV